MKKKPDPIQVIENKIIKELTKNASSCCTGMGYWSDHIDVLEAIIIVRKYFRKIKKDL